MLQNKEFDKRKTFLEKREQSMKKIFSSLPENERKPKLINLDFNPEYYKYKEIDRRESSNKFYLKEEDYKTKNISYSPFLLFSPEDLYKNSQEKEKKENFEYYKRHILLENYDEKPEEEGLITKYIQEKRIILNDSLIYGYTKWFDVDGKFEWKKCRLMDYNEESKLFHLSIPLGPDKEIFKHVTRFNFLFDTEDSSLIDLRVIQAEKWKKCAQKYIAYYHFVSSFQIEGLSDFVTENFMEKIFTLSFIYSTEIKPHFTPTQISILDNSHRYGINRNLAKKRMIEMDRNKLNKIFQTKKIDNTKKEFIKNEIKQYYERSVQMIEFYRQLPLNYDLFTLLSTIIPKEKFLTSSEIYLHPSREIKGPIKIERHRSFLSLFKKMESKLFQSENDMEKLLRQINQKQIEDFKDKIFFYTNWFEKPISLKTFKNKNILNIENVYKDVNFMIGNANYEIVSFLKERLKLAKKINKGAILPDKDIKKFKNFQNLVNRKISTFIRDFFHKSMDSLTDTYKMINSKVQLPKNNISIGDLLAIRDDYDLELKFSKDFEFLQFSFEMVYTNSAFYIVPNFDKYWRKIEKLIRNNILKNINSTPGLSVYELFTVEEQKNYYINNATKLKVFFEDDKSYEDEILLLKSEVKSFFNPVESFLEILNSKIKLHLTELTSFYKDIKNKNYDEESLNTDVFRYFINLNKTYKNFFEETFKYDNFFLGSISIDTKALKGYWVNRLEEIKEATLKLVIGNNIYLSKKMEEERDSIEKKLDIEPETVEDYDELKKYCNKLTKELEVIWTKIDSQQKNAELLDENFYQIKREDFFRMWSCYGIPLTLYIKKEDTLTRLVNDRKRFKKDLKQKYIKIIKETVGIRNDFESALLIEEIDDYVKHYHVFSELKYRIEKMIDTCNTFNTHENIIGKTLSDLTDINEINQKFVNCFTLWESVYNFESRKVFWLTDPLKRIDRNLLKNTFEEVTSTIDKLEKYVFKKHKPAQNKVILLIKEKINEFQPYLPVLYDLTNPDFKANQIIELSKAIGLHIPENMNVTFTELIERNILDYANEINERSTYATGQKKLFINLEKYKEKFKNLTIEMGCYKNSNLLVLKNVEPLVEDIEILLTKVVSMSSSKYAKYLHKDVQIVIGNLTKSGDIIEAWVKVQKLLLQQFKIFTFGDLKKQLQEEAMKYESVEKQWKVVMEQVRLNPHIVDTIHIPKIKDTFTKSISLLEEILKSLNAYLNTKRDIFPRLYFVSNEQLTEMLSLCEDPKIIASSYIQEVFDGIKRLNYEVDKEKTAKMNSMISEQNYYNSGSNMNDDSPNRKLEENISCYYYDAMISEQGEIVPFLDNISPFEEYTSFDDIIIKPMILEKWLLAVEKGMEISLRTKFLDTYTSLIKNNKRKDEWAELHMEQAVLTISQLLWTYRVEEAVNKINTMNNPDAIKELYKEETISRNRLIQKIRSKNISKLFKKTLISLIIQDVHANDVINYLDKNNITSTNAFEWVSQLRFYFSDLKTEAGMNSSTSILVRMLSTERKYDYEYIGNQKRLVITPLTDRCYRTMMEALNNCLGGAAEGPAGTGKTETIKDLSRNLGKKCFTYNCSEDSNYILLTKFFKGIAMSGCWVCLDEFNRISVDVLSVIAYQISNLQDCLKSRIGTCRFEDSSFPFNSGMGVFITMNPDYAGRSDLPDNLKGLFRPITMMIPNYDMICEIMLYSFGFKIARTLSKKIVSSLRLASEQLSSQTHYDYGMRTLNAIINYIGVLIVSEDRKDSLNSFSEEGFEEELIVHKAIRDSNMPKFTADDYEIYKGILSDLFPNRQFLNKEYELLTTCIQKQMKELNLKESDYSIRKVLDLKNVMTVRHSVIIIGKPMSHKSTILKLYLQSMNESFQESSINKNVKSQIINPKSITSAQLFGCVNKKTNEFNDGICSKVFRDYFNDNSNDLKFLIFDGPVDTLWIENMNSVLDDSKQLCLENSDQIRLDEKTFVIFETDDLSQASLATISRCGMIYMDRNNTNPSDYFYAWIKTFPSSFQASNLLELCTDLYESIFEILLNKFYFDDYNNLVVQVKLPVFKNWLTKNFLQIFESLIFINERKDQTKDIEEERILKTETSEYPSSKSINENKEKFALRKAFTKTLLSKSERISLLNKFIYSLYVSLSWLIDDPKDQNRFYEKLIRIADESLGLQSFQFKEEMTKYITMISKKDVNELIYNPDENSWENISGLISTNRDDTVKRLRENLSSLNEIIVHTTQSYRAIEIIKNCRGSLLPLLFCGPTATGKSLLVKDYLNSNAKSLTDNNWLSYTFILNYKTSATNVCDSIEEKISLKIKKNLLTPPNNKNCIILIEDLNMPMKEKFGAQPPVEIIRQHFDYGGWWDRKEKEFIYLNNLLFYSFLTIGRPLVSERLLWHFIPITFNELNEESLNAIYDIYFKAKFFEYSSTIRKLQDQIVDKIVKSYMRVVNHFKPLPATPHYSFNMRDLHKVFNGLTMIKSQALLTRIDQAEYMNKLLIHETTRVYGDRLISNNDRQYLNDNIIKELLYNETDAHIDLDRLLCSEINDEENYKIVEDIEGLKSNIYKQIEIYNSNKKSKERIDLILFEYSLKHLLRLDRIFAKKAEHGVLVGLTGSGRQSLTKIAAFIKRFKIFKIRSRDEVEEYRRKEWLEDIKSLYYNTGMKQEPTAFIIEDNNITDESMYVDLNCIISSGIVYNLFTPDEKAEWLSNLKSTKEIEDMNLLDDQAVWDVFIKMSMEKLKIILILNPLNLNFLRILRSFPALINYTSIDWYEEWPESALYYLAEKDFSSEEFNKRLIPLKKEIELTQSNGFSIRESPSDYNKTFVNNLSHIFSNSYSLLVKANQEYNKIYRKNVIILPKSFLGFIEFFRYFTSKFIEDSQKKIKKYEDGVRKLKEAAKEIEKMTKILESKKPILIEKSKYMEITIKEIEIQTKDAEEFRKKCTEDEIVATLKKSDAEQKKERADFIMKQAEILKQEIQKKIMMIDNKQFFALRSFRVPPKEVTKMMQAISLIMSNFDKKPMEIIPQEWEFFKKKLNDVKLLKYLESLPKKLETTLLNNKIVKLLEPFVTDPDLEPVYMEKKISSTCMCFCVYFRCMYQLDDLLKTQIIPSAKESESAIANLKYAQDNLELSVKKLIEVEENLNQLTLDYNEKNLQKMELEYEIEESKKKLNRAQRLINKLGGEKDRWGDIADKENKNKINMLGDVIITSIYISFMGPYLNFFREEFITLKIFPLLESCGLKYSGNYSISKLIGNPFKIQDWIINGLPSDPGSIDNAIILHETTKQCLLIDPQKQAITFLNKLYKNDLIIFKNSDDTRHSYTDSNAFLKLVEKCGKNGKCLVFENISFDVPNEAEILLNAEIIHKKSNRYLKINEYPEILLHPNFRFFLISYLTNPTFNSELYDKISIINFSVTNTGLTEQLLSVIIKEESPKDEMEKINILQNLLILSETISKQEDDILAKLNVEKEKLLDDDALVISLEETKKLSDEALSQIASSKLTEEKLDNFRMLYVPLASLAALIFFAILDLNSIEDIYQFSITWFINDVLIKSIRRNSDIQILNKAVANNTLIEKRIIELKSMLLEVAYKDISRSLLNKDKILFAFLILIRKLSDSKQITSEEAQFLFNRNFKSSLEENQTNELMKSKPEFIENNKWIELNKLNKIESFSGILNEITEYPKKWKQYFMSDNPNFEFPSKKFNSLSNIKKFLLVKIINLNNLIHYIKELIKEYFETEELISSQLFTIEDLFSISNFSKPLLLITTPGLDPSEEVKRISEENDRTLITLSLGQGQGKKSLNSIEQCKKKGDWVFLQNLHLVPNFMKSLEHVISNLQGNEKTEVNPLFRLWISALPTNNILSSILVNSLKITIESPSDAKANLHKLIKSQEKRWNYETESIKRINKDYEYLKLYMGLIHFHTIILQRKSYGPLGWNIKYNFNDSDFMISKSILRNNIEKYSTSEIPYKAIIYLTADCIYGGRVTDEWDRRTIHTILEDFYNSQVIIEESYEINNIPGLKLPCLDNYKDYLNYASNINQIESPEYLGLHKNALIKKQIDESNMLLQSLSCLQDNTNFIDSDRESMLLNISKEFNKKILKSFDLEAVRTKYPLKYEDSMNSILIQEIMRYNSLLNLIFKSLDDTVKAYKGLIPITDEIEEISSQLISNKTPQLWIKCSYPSLKPIASWMIDLEQRLGFFSTWIDIGAPLKYWFSAFYFTQSFLTAIKQNYARKNKISIDRLDLTFSFIDSEDYDKTHILKRDAYFTYGLFIEGAEWNKQTHSIDELKGINLHSLMPPVLLGVKEISEDGDVYDKSNEITFYECPVYKCSSRHGSLSTTGHSTNYIFTIQLPTLKPAKHWVKRGVALLSQLDQ